MSLLQLTGAWAGVSSDEDAGYAAAQSFSGLTGAIGSAKFWGLALSFPWAPCTEDPRTFVVTFYEAGDLGGTPFATHIVDASPVATGEVASGFPIWEYSITFPGVNLSDGFISIVGQGGNSCWFLWWNSEFGAGTGWQDDGGWAQYASPMSLCLGSGGGSGSWLTLDYYENDVAPMGGLDNVPTNFNAAGTEAGEIYHADLIFTSDPDVGTITIPCTMIIAGDPMVPPTDLTVEFTDEVNGDVELNWTWATDLTFQFFIINRDGVQVGTSTTTTYTETLPDYDTYCYTVQTYYDEGTSAPCEEACIDWDFPIISIVPDFHEAEVWTDHMYVWEAKIFNLGDGPLQYDFPPPSTEFTIDLYDSFGDGWTYLGQTSSLDVLVNGVVVLDQITLATGTGPETYYFDAMPGDEISTVYYQVDPWSSENSYYIYDPMGVEIANDGVGGAVPSGIPAGTLFAGPAGFVVDITPSNGIVEEGSNETVFFTWDATGYTVGDYTQETVCESNDQVNPVVPVNHLMHVVEPAEFAGTVSDCESGFGIPNVTVTAGPFQTTTNFLGAYSLFVDEGTYDVYFDKLDYVGYMEPDTSALAGVVTPLDVELCEAPYPVPWVIATVNYPDEDFCDVEWSLPEGPYEVYYDDGTAEDLFVWNTSGSENAVLFTPAGYPANVFGGRVFVGDGIYPPGGWLGTDFAMIVYDDDGTDGMPGTMLDSVHVTVNNYGWVEFFGLDVTLEEGEFYLSMLQLTAPPAAPIGIDLQVPTSYRSYQNAAGGLGWVLSPYQDFMMRAYIDGSQTDVITDSEEMVYPSKVSFEEASKEFTLANNTGFEMKPGTVKAGQIGNIEGYDASESVLFYTVARISDFDPDLPIDPPLNGTLTVLNNVTTLTYQDTDFEALPMGWYAYGVQVAYSTTALSPYTFSNIVGRDMDAEVTFEVILCDGNVPEDVDIAMQGLDFPTESFEGTTDATGIFTFPQVWKGLYDVILTKVGYEDYKVQVLVTEDMTVEVIMSENKRPARNLVVDPITGYAMWDQPMYIGLELEDFEGATMPPTGWQMTTNSVGWFLTMDGSSAYWEIPTWDSQYACSNDDAAGEGADGSVDYLITPEMDLRETTDYNLYFDSFYDQLYGTQIATIEYSYDMGTTWEVLGSLTPSEEWESYEVSLASITGLDSDPLMLAFHSDDGGAWSSGWAVDNVSVTNGLIDPPGGYHVYLDGTFVAETDTTFYQYEYLEFGVTYTASVAAVYSCGLSDEIYYTFGSLFLLPPRNLDGLTFDNTVQVWWEPPLIPETDAVSIYDPNFVPVAENAETFYSGTVVTGYKALASTRALLWDNGPMVNSPGTGAGGADESILQDGVNTYGFGAQNPLPNIIADDFTVSGGDDWVIDDFVFYAYQSNSGAPPSTITGVFVEIYDGEPGNGGAVIWGDQVTNIMTDTDWTGIYRNNDGPGGATNRAIMFVVASTPGLTLLPGDYWVAYSFTGSAASGPWAPPICISGTPITGNAVQWTATYSAWGPLVSGASGEFPQGMPFLINGTITTGGGGGGGGIPENLLGYNLYRDDVVIAEVPYTGLEMEEYFDYELEPLCYEYNVTALYDMTDYGFPGEIGESHYEGPFDVCVEYGWPLAFVEDWNTGSFDPNLWDHGDNWVVNGQFGNPLPCAEFKWDPVLG